MASGMTKLKIEEAAAKKQARIDAGKDVIVGVNKYRLDHEQQVEVLKIDNAKVREEQCAKLNHIRATRDAEKAQKALDAITEGARGNGNLMELAIEAARARCTVGEISDAMEKVFNRHAAVNRLVSGAYKSEFGETSEMSQVSEFQRKWDIKRRKKN